MSDHRPTYKTKRRQSHTEEPALPAGHVLVPVTEWRLSNLDPADQASTQRIQSFGFGRNATRAYAHPDNAFSNTEPPTIGRVASRQHLNRTNTDNTSDTSPQQQRAALARLEDMLESFQLIYLGLPSGTQIQLRDQLEEAKLALWAFSNEKQTQRREAREESEKAELEERLSIRLEKLMKRLRELTNTHESRDAISMEKEDSLWDENCLTLGAMIESMLLTLTSSSLTNTKGSSANQAVPPLTAPPGAVKLRTRSLGYQALAQEKKKKKQREGEKMARQAQQSQTRVLQGAQPTDHKEDALFEFEHLGVLSEDTQKHDD